MMSPRADWIMHKAFYRSLALGRKPALEILSSDATDTTDVTDVPGMTDSNSTVRTPSVERISLPYDWGGPAMLETLRGAFIKRQRIGHGAQSNAFKVPLRDGQFAVQKETQFISRKEKAQFRNELNILKRLGQNEYTTQLVAAHEDIGGGWIVIVPYARLATFDEFTGLVYSTKRVEQAFDVLHDAFQKLLLALKFLESQSIVHRDVKPGNVLVDTTNVGPNDMNTLQTLHLRWYVVKLSDFGISKYLQPDERCRTQLGTTMYFSPQRLNGNPYAFEADRWSAGVMMLQSLRLGSLEDVKDGRDVYRIYPCVEDVHNKISLPKDHKALLQRCENVNLQDFVSFAMYVSGMKDDLIAYYRTYNEQSLGKRIFALALAQMYGQ